MYIISKLNKSVNQKGSSLSLPAHPSSRTLCVHYGAGGRAGARATPFIATLFAKQKTKFGGGGKARAGREGKGVWGKGIPAPPERKLSKVSVWIFVKKGSDFNQKAPPIENEKVNCVDNFTCLGFRRRFFALENYLYS